MPTEKIFGGLGRPFVEIVIFLSDAVARQHRIVHADLCISLSLLFPNIRHIYTTDMICMYINVNLINWSTKSFPVPLTKLMFSVNFASMSTSGRQIKYSLNINLSSELHDITPNNCTYIHVYTCQII